MANSSFILRLASENQKKHSNVYTFERILIDNIHSLLSRCTEAGLWQTLEILSFLATSSTLSPGAFGLRSTSLEVPKFTPIHLPIEEDLPDRKVKLVSFEIYSIWATKLLSTSATIVVCWFV